MQKFKGPQNTLSYLDVSQFIIKETSPLIKPSSPQHPPHLQSHRIYHTPEIQPIDHDTSQFLLTPLNKHLRLQDMSDFMDAFSLDSTQTNFSDRKKTSIKNRDLKQKQIQSSVCQLFLLQCDLEKIVEDDQQLKLQSQESEEESQVSQEQSKVNEKQEEINIVPNTWNNKIKSQDTNLRDTEEQKHTVFQISPIDYSENIERFTKNPKSEILQVIKSIQNQKQVVDEAQKMVTLKKYLEQYMLQFQFFCHEQSWNKLTGDFKSIANLISLGIQQIFAKKIGPINFEQRRVKLLKYLEKKKRRIWRKKVSYDCRKKVADGRLRIKGKFVTREQACQQLGFVNLDHYSPQQIKQMLQRRIDSLQQPQC